MKIDELEITNFNSKETRSIRKEYEVPPMWEETKEYVKKKIQEILEDDKRLRKIEITFSAGVDEVPILRVEKEFVAFEGADNGR